MTKRYALISVSDKTGIGDFAKQLCDLGFSLISTGGTAKLLRDSGLEVTNVSDITGFPECLDGRVKTLHPMIHGGLLAQRENKEHMEMLDKLGIATIDIAVINLYPFKKTIQKDDVTFEDAIENIDIGGPAMIRAAAKNHNDVTVLTDPADYERVLSELRETGNTTYETRRYLAYKVFAHTAAYDALIADYLSKQCNITFPDSLTLPFEAVQDLRYGENPHQNARYYKELINTEGALTSAEQLHGKELSYNNIADTNGALELLSEFEEITVVAVKHANPCGVGSAATLSEAWDKAYNADPTSIFGGIVAVNTVMDKETAEKINKIFIEIVVAPDYTEEALGILSAKKNIRLLKLPSAAKGVRREGYDCKRVSGGLLVQERDMKLMDEVVCVTKRKPTEKEMQDLMFAWRIVKHVKSNAIALAKDNSSVGIGCGQVNRIWATQQAIEHGGENTSGSCMASDAFFPFDDCVRAAAAAGITAIVHPGGSKNDEQSIQACDELGIAMITVGMRHFKHS
ncbi:MAG: bifunctional phosphoribosylaminoimidazolecarboxamide formyltransferase/IMP cyclohydrolase [Clostridia bacterium]|nr:bifunctional phosphoribosylaminoimidazolecarboxamide formyltransferase/IMP cyclohydrolase [Clostridia bacterium]